MQDLIDQVAAVAALQANITEGPWAFEMDEYDGAGIFVDEDGDGEKPNPCMMVADHIRQGESDGEADAQFICAVRDVDFAAIAVLLRGDANRLPDAFTNAIGLLGHLGREGVAEHLEAVARIWQKRISQIPAKIEALKKERDGYQDQRSEMGHNPDNEEEQEALYVSVRQCDFAIEQLEGLLKADSE